MNVNTINSHPRDKRLRFLEETHQYFLDGEELEPVTSVIENLFEKFDAVYWSRRKTSTESEAAALRKLWEDKAREAASLGTQMHSRIEHYYLTGEVVPEGDDMHCFRLFLSFDNTYRLKPYRTEWRIYHEDAHLAGTLDFLAQDGKDFYIYDWKRSTKLVDPYGHPMPSNPMGKTGFGVASSIPDSSLYHYALQLSVYRYILEEKYAIFPKDCYLGVFSPENQKPYRVRVPYLKSVVEALIEQRKR